MNGDNLLALCLWMAHRVLLKEKVVIHENVPQFLASWLEYFLGHIYHIYSNVCDAQVGVASAQVASHHNHGPERLYRWVCHVMAPLFQTQPQSMQLLMGGVFGWQYTRLKF